MQRVEECAEFKIIRKQRSIALILQFFQKLRMLAGYWALTLLTAAPQNNTYNVVAVDRQGTCGSYLSCTGCGANVVDIFGAVSPTWLSKYGSKICNPQQLSVTLSYRREASYTVSSLYSRVLINCDL